MPANDKSTQDYFGHAIILSDTHVKARTGENDKRESHIQEKTIQVTPLTDPSLSFRGGFTRCD